ncbi:MAG: hypothetical protein WAL98_20520 [Desulfatiglandaceae bacterium]|jgi:hypothetical protein
MEPDQGKYSLIKEMFIVFILGGSLGLVLLIIAELIARYVKGA